MKLTNWLISFSVALFTIFLLSSCIDQDQPSLDSDTIRIAASIFPLADWCKNITPDSAQVFTLIPPNQSPHLFEPGISDSKKLHRAGFVVRMGYGFDDWIQPLIQNTQNNNTKVLILEQAESASVHDPSIEQNQNSSEHGRSHENNPHLWLDPVWAQDAVRMISQHLKNQYPDQSEEIETRTEEYLLKLFELHQEISQTLQSLPIKNMWAITALLYPLRNGMDSKKSPPLNPGREKNHPYGKFERLLKRCKVWSNPLSS